MIGSTTAVLPPRRLSEEPFKHRACSHRRELVTTSPLPPATQNLIDLIGATMFYTMYLSSVCQRRQWPEPHYEPYRTRSGWHCKVRVNNREYSTEVPYASEGLARDGAAQKGYMICRNFSVNDGMGPGQRPGQTVQGLPVAIGTGRGGKRGSAASYDTASTDGTSSGGNSPRSTESGFEQQIRHVTPQVPKPSSSSSSSSPSSSATQQLPRRTKAATTDGYICYCQRAPVRAYGRCAWCLQESGWQ